MNKDDSVHHKNLQQNTHKAYIDIKQHLLLLVIPLLLISILTFVFIDADQAYLYLLLICAGYVTSYAVTYYVHKQNMLRLWQHLAQVVRINDTTFELVNLSNQYDSEKSFLDALLQKAVNAIDDAEMGSIILVDNAANRLQFESVIGLNIETLRSINFTLEETFL